MTPGNQIIVLTTYPSIPFNFRIKEKAELEERHRINTECMKQDLSMQHHRDLQIVGDEAQRRLYDVLSQVRPSEEKAIVQSRQIENIKHKLRSCKVSNLQDIFKFAPEEDQKQKIRALDFETKPDTIAHCNIQILKGSSCCKCGNEGHFIKDCPLHQNNHMQQNNLTPNHKHSYVPHSRSNSKKTDMLAPITQTLSNLLEQIKQLSTTSTSSHSTFSHHKSHHNNTDKHKHKPHNRDPKHKSHGNFNRNKSYSENTHNRTHHSRHNHRTRVNEIEEFSECSWDCTDALDCEEQLDSPSQSSSNLPATLREPEQCLTENWPHASQNVTDENFDNLVLDNPVEKTVNNIANDDTEIVHLHRKSANECALMVLLGNRHHKALWDSGAGKCVISFDCYQSIPTKYKTELYPSSMKVKAANGIVLPT